MYEDLIAALMQDMDVDSRGARARALRDSPAPPPPPPPMAQGGATGGWDAPPPQQMPPPPPPTPLQDWGSNQQPAGQAPAAFSPPQATLPPAQVQKLPQAGPGPVPGPIGAAKPGPMLPQALAGAGANPDVDPFDVQARSLRTQHEGALADLNKALQPPDTGPMEAAYRQRAQESPSMLLQAMAAERLGKAGLAKHFYGQAADVDKPLKTDAGTMTPQGFIQDPAFKQALAVKSAEARVTAIERAEAANISAAERRRLEKEKFEAMAELKRTMAEYQRGTTWGAAGIAAGTGAGGGPAGPGKATYEGVDSATGKEVVRDKQGRPWRQEGSNPDGTPKYVPVVGGDVIPKASFEKNVKEATELAQAAAGATTLLTQVEKNPSAFGLGAAAADYVPGVLGKSRLQKALGMTPEAVQLRANFSQAAAAEMSRLYGAAQSAGEATRAERFLINPGKDDIDVVIAKLKGGREYAEEARARWGKAVSGSVTQRTGIENTPTAAPAGGGREVNFTDLPKGR